MKRSPTHFEALFGRAPGPVVVFDARFTIVAANRAYIRTTGATGDIIGRDVLDIFPEGPGDQDKAGRPSVRASLERVLSTGEADEMPVTRYDFPRPDDQGGGFEERYWKPSSYPVPGEDGRVEYIIHQAEDVTDLVRLRRREARLTEEVAEDRNVSEALPDRGIFAGRLGLDGTVIDADRRGLEQYGDSLADVIGKPVWECGCWNRSPEVRAWVKSAFEHASRGESFRGASTYERADGTERLVEFACMPISGRDGRIRSFVATGVDITDLTRAGQDLRSAEILESITDAFYAVGRDWRFSYVNREAERLLGRSREDLIGKSIWQEFPEAAEVEFDPAYRRAMAEGEAASFEVYYPPHERWYEVNVSPTPDGIASYFRDITARRNSAEELARLTAESERQRRVYEAALSNTPDLVFVFDLAHRFTYANEALLALWGRSREDSLGKTCLELGYEPWHAEMHDREIEQVIATKAPIRGVVPFEGTGGRRIYDYIFVPVIGADGSVVAVAGTTRDITDRQQTEEALRRSQGRLAAALAVASLGTFEWDLRTDCVTLDDRSREIFGFAPGEGIHAREVFDRIDPSDLDRVSAEVQDSRESLTRLETEYRINLPDGTARTIISISDAISGADGAAERMFGVFVDITARRRNERALAESQARTQLAVEIAQLGTFEIDLLTDAVTVNEPGRAIYGWESTQTTFSRVRTHFDPGDRDAVMREVGSAFDPSGPGTFELEQRIIRTDGEIRWIRVRGRAFFDGEAAVRCVGTYLDITDRKRDEEALRRSEAKLRFLANLDALTRTLTDPDEVTAASARLLGEHLAVDRCAYAEIEDEAVFVIVGDHLRGVSSILGRWPVAAFGRECLGAMLENEPFIVSDTDADPRLGPDDLPAYRATDIRAVICVPLHKGGRFSAAMAVHQKTPRRWSPEDIELVQLVVSRCWEAIERTRVARSLRESEERFRAIVSQATAGIAEVDLTGRFTLVNQTLCETLGYSLPELLRMRMQDITHPDDLPANVDQFRALAGGGPDFRIEKRYVRRDGSIVWVNNSVAAVRDASGRARSIVAVVFNVTERRRTEEALRDSEEELRKFKFLSDNANMAFLLVNDRGQIAYANKFACRERGYAENGLAGVPVSELNRYSMEQIASVFEKNRVDGVAMFEAVHFRRDGSSFPVEVLTTYLDLEDGPHLFSAVRDITEQRETQARQDQLLRQVEAERSRLDHVFQRSPSFMATLKGPEHIFELVNERYYQLVGHRELLGRPVREALPEIEGQGFLRLLDQVYGSGEPYIGKAVRVNIRRAPGLLSERIVEFVYEPIRDADGQISGILAHGIDLTEHMLAEEALREADRRKDEFLAMLAHELRNPLSAIGNAVQVMRRNSTGEHLEWARDVIDKHVRSLSRMIDDLLDVSRITRGKIELKRQALDVLDVVSHAVETVRPLVEERKHDLTISHSSAPMWVDADPHRLEQVLVNLLANAAKYTESGGEIGLDARAGGDSITLSIIDNGNGIPPGKIPEMFELFAQGDRTIARSEGGLGIGLTLVKSLIELHGGSVTARSEGLGKGSEFTVRLPAVPAPGPELPSETPPVSEEPRDGFRVLVVDDNVDSVRGLVTLLGILGHDVEAAHDGPSALKAAHAHRPEFVLLDIGLPGMDGYQVAEQLRAEGFRETTIIGISGYGEEAARRRSLEAGFDHHFVKPVDYEMIDSLMRGRPGSSQG